MTSNQFKELFDHLHAGLGTRPVAGQAEVWFQIIRARGFSYAMVAKAVETLVATSKRSRPLPADLIAECSKIAMVVAESEYLQRKKEEEQPWRAKTVDGTPVALIASKVSKALKGDEEMREELGWAKTGTEE